MTPEEKKWVEEVKGYCFRPSSPWINGRKDVDLPRAISIIEKQERRLDAMKDFLGSRWLLGDFEDYFSELEEMEK